MAATAPPPGFEQSQPATPDELNALPNHAAIQVLEQCITSHHVAEVDYTDAQGRRSTISVRPAYIRYNAAGHLVLWNMRTGQNHWEELRIDRIHSARDTGEEFTPTW